MHPKLLMDFLRDENAATAIEYGLIAALIGVSLIATFIIFGHSVLGLFDYVNNNAGAAIDAAGA